MGRRVVAWRGGQWHGEEGNGMGRRVVAYLYWFGMMMVGVSDCSTRVPKDFTRHEPFEKEHDVMHNDVMHDVMHNDVMPLQSSPSSCIF